VVEDLTLWHPG